MSIRCPAALALLALLAFAGCGAPPPPSRAPAGLVGDWVDDYDIRYTIVDSLWFQHPRSGYQILRWDKDTAGTFLVARNRPENTANGGLYTRIDWVALPESPPWEWAFCLTTWDANSAAGAAAAPTPDRTTLRTGCGGHPFSRMRRVPADSLLPGGGGDP